jgi:hypothetical protein
VDGGNFEDEKEKKTVEKDDEEERIRRGKRGRTRT